METSIFRVKQVGPVQSYTSAKPTVGQSEKRQVVLQCLGGDYEDAFAATQFGLQVREPMAVGDIVAARLAMMVHDYQGQCYQDVLLRDVVKLNVN